jgi:hypothetical protein
LWRKKYGCTTPNNVLSISSDSIKQGKISKQFAVENNRKETEAFTMSEIKRKEKETNIWEYAMCLYPSKINFLKHVKAKKQSQIKHGKRRLCNKK